MKRTVFFLIFMLLSVMPVLAQEDVENLVISGDAGELNRDAIKEAAQPLLKRGATVVVYFVQEGGQDDFYNRLDEEGHTTLRGSRVLESNLVAIYVSMNRYSEILVGDTWADELPSSRLETIRQNQLNRSLRSANYSTAFVNTLGALESGIRNPVYTPSFSYDYSTDETSEGLPPGVITCGVIVLIGVSLYLQAMYPEYFQNSDDDSYRPRHSYKSSWRSSSSSGSSSRSSSSGRGSRSGGSW